MSDIMITVDRALAASVMELLNNTASDYENYIPDFRTRLKGKEAVNESILVAKMKARSYRSFAMKLIAAISKPEYEEMAQLVESSNVVEKSNKNSFYPEYVTQAFSPSVIGKLSKVDYDHAVYEAILVVDFHRTGNRYIAPAAQSTFCVRPKQTNDRRHARYSLSIYVGSQHYVGYGLNEEQLKLLKDPDLLSFDRMKLLDDLIFDYYAMCDKCLCKTSHPDTGVCEICGHINSRLPKAQA